MNPVTLYTTAFCPYCQMAERLLASKGVTPNWYELGPLVLKQDGDREALQDAEQIRLRIAGAYFAQQARKAAA